MDINIRKVLLKKRDKKYMLIIANAAMLFIFATIYLFIPNKYFNGLNDPDNKWSYTTLLEKIYFTVITHLTVGYGDYHLKGSYQLVSIIHLLSLLVVNIFIAAS